MKIEFRLFPLYLIILTLGFFKLDAQTSSYSALDDVTGIRGATINSHMTQICATIKDSFPSGYTGDFKVFDGGIYLHAVNTDRLYHKSIDHFTELAENQSSPYLLFIREITNVEGLDGNVTVKLELTDSYYTINETTKIKSELEEYINVRILQKKQFFDIVDSVIIIFKQKIGPARNVFTLTSEYDLMSSGYDSIPLYKKIVIKNEVGNNITDAVVDYSNIELRKFQNENLNISLSDAFNDLANFNIRLIITSDFSTANEINLAQAAYEAQTNFVSIVWFHVKKMENLGSGEFRGKLFCKARSKMTSNEARSYVTVQFENFIAGQSGGAFGENENELQSREEECASLNAWRTNPCLFNVLPIPKNFKSGIGSGLIDGALDIVGLLMSIHSLGTSAESWTLFTVFVAKSLRFYISFKHPYLVEEGYVEPYNVADLYRDIEPVLNFVLPLYDAVTAEGKFLEILESIYNQLTYMIGKLISTNFGVGYLIGAIVFEIIAEIASGGSKSAVTFLQLGAKGLGDLVKALADPNLIRNAISKNWDNVSLVDKVSHCEVLSLGCFVKNTPVYIARNKLNSLATGLIFTISPILHTIPIQEVQLFDYVLAHTTVNSSSGLTAGMEDFQSVYSDLYVSQDQRTRDQYEINDKDWYEVSFDQILGSSECKLALHKDWIKRNNYLIDNIIYLELPEQRISGPFRITSIKKLMPKEVPVDSDTFDSFEYRPVTGLFVHETTKVLNLGLDNDEKLGVTSSHPLYSLTHNGWRTADELEVGDRIMTKLGSVIILSKERDAKITTVYNLEVKDLHNYLVGSDHVVAHNGYLDELYNVYKHIIGNKGLKHIFQGEIVNGTASGVHHIKAIKEGTAKIIGDKIPVGPPDKGIYKAKIAVKDADGQWISKIDNGGYSTFFPDDMHEGVTMNAIEQASNNIISIISETPTKVELVGFTDEGIEIFITRYPNTITIYQQLIHITNEIFIVLF